MEHKENPNSSSDYAFSIVEIRRLMNEIEVACLHAATNGSREQFVDIARLTSEVELHTIKLSVWAKNRYVEIIK